MPSALHIGTCSWKYDSWRGLVYSDAAKINYLAEYSKKYDCVEIDQWFWSLYGPDKVVLPQPKVVAEYAASVPADFRFGVKLPNAPTLSHYPQSKKTDPLIPNPHFLSTDLLKRFMDQLEPLHGKLGPMMMQFGYLNKQKMPSQSAFLAKLDAFVSKLPADYTWCVESRNPNYLTDEYFHFLKEHKLAHVWLQGYYMPQIFDIYAKQAPHLTNDVIIRLHGPDREGMEDKSGKDWSKVIEPRDTELDTLSDLLKNATIRRRFWVFVNNHYEGCAPITIDRIKKRMEL
jgi:uncharacterized protein YecE (DUF72 family)